MQDVNKFKVFYMTVKLQKYLKINNVVIFLKKKEINIRNNIGRMKTEKKISSIEWIKNNEINLMTKVG